MRRTGHFLAITMICLAALGAAPAWGAFSARGIGTSNASVAVMRAPASVAATVAPGATTVHVAWDAATAPAGSLDGYAVERVTGATVAPACGTSIAALTAATTCDDGPVPAGTYTYRVRAVFRSWTASTTSTPVSVTPDAGPPVLGVTFPAAGGYDAAAWDAGCASALCGSASDADTGVVAVHVSVRRAAGNYWDGASFASASEVLLTATGTVSWTAPFAAANFPADDTYTVRVVAADAVGFTTSSSVIVTYDNTPPVSALALAAGATNSSLSGQTLYYRGNAPGSFAFVDTVTDAASPPTSVVFPAVAAAGWSHPAQIVTTPTGGPFSSSAFSWSAGASQPSPYTITASDATRNESTSSVVFADDSAAPTFTLLRIAPAFNTTANGYIRAGAQYYVYANVEDASSGIATVTADVSALGSGSTPATFTASTYEAFGTTFNYRSEILTAGATLREGGKSVFVTVTDSVGNSASLAKNVIVDNTAPTVTFTFPIDEHQYDASRWAAGCNPDGLCGTAEDDGTWRSGVREVRVWVRRESDDRWWNGTSWQTTIAPLTATGTTAWHVHLPASALTNGVEYALSAQAFDVAGNSSTPPSGVTFTYDTTPPN
jgi:hypothetical protein